MGVNSSKPKEPPESRHKTKSKDANEIIIFSNGDKYEGHVRDNEICGQGTYFYRNNDFYKGEWKNNKKHGKGTHCYVNQGKRYVGEWQNGFYHGHGEMFYNDKSSFKGTFFEGEKHGTGHFQDSKGRIFEERWVYGALKGRTLLSDIPDSDGGQIEENNCEGSDEDEPAIPKLNIPNNKEGTLETQHNPRRVLIFNEVERINKNDEDTNDEDKNDSNNDKASESRQVRKPFETEIPQTLVVSNNGSQNDSRYEDTPNSTKERRMSESSADGKENNFAVGALRSQEGELDSGKEDFGVDTLNILEHMEALNSAGNYLLSKRIENWSTDDVSEWLKHLGLGEYTDQFKSNDISGANLLDLTDAELKQEFKITSLGHRKNIRKAIDQLTQIYRSGKDIEYVKEKIGMYYNKVLRFKKTKSINSFGSMEGGLANLRKLYSGVYNSNQVIHEDHDEAEMFSNSPQENKATKGKSDDLDDFMLNSGQEKNSRANNDEDDEGDGLPRSKCRPLFASDISGELTPVETKRKKKRSSGSKTPGSGKGSIIEAKEPDSLQKHELQENRSVEAVVRIPSPFKKEDPDGKGKEERSLHGNYLLHNQYDSHEHRENIKKHASGQTPSYEDSSSPDSEVSSSNDEEEESKPPVIRPGTAGSAPTNHTYTASGAKNNLNLHQVLLGTTGLGQIVQPIPQYGETKLKKDALNLENIGEYLPEIHKPFPKRNQSDPNEVKHKQIRHNNSPPALHYDFYDNDIQNTRPQLRHEGQMRRFEEQNHLAYKKQVISEEKTKIKKTKKNKSALSTKERENKIKEEILKIFKQTGLNENFIINYDELTINGKIGEGGYGQVYEGLFSGTQVAIKEYGKRKLLGKAAEDFVKEVEVISSLRHPNIILYMGACIHQGKYLMITEYLEQGSLFDHLHRKHSKIPEEHLLGICEDIALGMTYLHSRKVFHCDLKSSNILIDSNWSVKLCDFGLSRNKIKYNKKKVSKSQRVGTPHWMAPEILRGEHYDEQSDVYSYGMVLWEIITGEIPYYNMNVNDIIMKVGWEGKQVEIPTRGNPLIIQIMKMCLSIEREKRPTFKEIVDKLQPKLKDTHKVKSSKLSKK